LAIGATRQTRAPMRHIDSYAFESACVIEHWHVATRYWYDTATARKQSQSRKLRTRSRVASTSIRAYPLPYLIKVTNPVKWACKACHSLLIAGSINFKNDAREHNKFTLSYYFVAQPIDMPGSIGYFYYLCRLTCTSPAQRPKEDMFEAGIQDVPGGDMRQLFKAPIHLKMDEGAPVSNAIVWGVRLESYVPRSR
jgi:hypothetical protein